MAEDTVVENPADGCTERLKVVLEKDSDPDAETPPADEEMEADVEPNALEAVLTLLAVEVVEMVVDDGDVVDEMLTGLVVLCVLKVVDV